MKTGGYQPVYGTNPASSNLPNGQRNSGLAFNYFKISFTGNPSPNTAFLAELSDSARFPDTSGRSTQTADCIPSQNYLNGNAAAPTTLTNCSIVNASQAAYNAGETGFAPGFNNLWIQTSIPNSGLYLRVGHVQNNEGPSTGGFIGGDYYWGGQLGITKGPFNAYIGYGFPTPPPPTTPSTTRRIPARPSRSKPTTRSTWARVRQHRRDVQQLHRLQLDQWDPSAVLCNGAGGTQRYFANTAAVPFTTCGAGFTPVTYTNTAPITGYYLGAAANNPTYSGTAAAPAAFTTPGLVLTNPINMVGGHIQFVYGKARLYLAGTYHLGNDPYTGAAWVGPLSGNFVADYGPYSPGTGNTGKWTYEAQGLAVQYNGGMPNTNDFGGPVLDNSWTTNWAGLYWVEAAVKYWISDNTNIALGYGHSGFCPTRSCRRATVRARAASSRATARTRASCKST